jgi:hypothetical protein
LKLIDKEKMLATVRTLFGTVFLAQQASIGALEVMDQSHLTSVGACADLRDVHGALRHDRSPLADVHVPKWWTGEPSLADELYVIDASLYDLKNASSSGYHFDGELATKVREVYDRVGAVRVTKTGITDVQLMRAVAKFVLDKEIDYTGGANPRESLEPNVYEVGAPLTAWLQYHHEMAYLGHSTTKLAFLCNLAVPGKGETYLSDNVKATVSILETDLGQKLKEKGICYHRYLTDRMAFEGKEQLGVYNHWQLSMLTEDPEEAVRVARGKGLNVTWGPNRLLKTMYCTDAYEHHPKSGKNLLFSSIADDGMWFDTWEKVQHLPMDERPLRLTYGDQTPFTRAEKELFVDVYDRHGTPIRWEQGDVVVFDNYLFAHGRPSIYLEEGEERSLGVMLGESFTRLHTHDYPDGW